MSYYLGIDLGTTYASAATWRNGRVEVVTLGTRAAVDPSVVFIGSDDQTLTGEAADRRGVTDPNRVAREFKRRLGDPTPIVVGGVPFSADALMARQLRAIVAAVVEREGGSPAGIAVTHPASWGAYKLDLLRQAIARADLDDVILVSEPEAAAIHYASHERVDAGATIAVYDLGGGTFDAAILRKTADGWELLGTPQGIERLGGADFDEAVFQHVVTAIGDAPAELDPDAPTTRTAVSALRRECVAAKEVLSADTEAVIPVLLPNLQTEVRLTRRELEAMVRPALTDTIATLNRTMRSAGVDPAQIDAVLLVGGCSRMPLVAELVGAELGRPVAVDTHPKHSIAFGAAIVAANAGSATASSSSSEGGISPTASDIAPSAPSVASPAAAGTSPPPPGWEPRPPTSDGVSDSSPGTADAPGASHRSRVSLIGAVAAVLVIGGIVAAILATRGSDQDRAAQTNTTTVATATPPTSAPAAVDPTQPAVTVPTTAAATTPRVNLREVVLERGRYRVNYTVTGYTPKVDGGPDSLHIHFFLDTTSPENAGTNGNPPGTWELTDEPTTLLTQFGPSNRGQARQMCAVVATVDHGVFDPKSGNCLPLPDA
jgi:molecular chaperone DnaK